MLANKIQDDNLICVASFSLEVWMDRGSLSAMESHRLRFHTVLSPLYGKPLAIALYSRVVETGAS